MPVSKRDKKVSLTQTAKKGLDHKNRLVDNIRKFIEMYEHLFVFTVNNMRNAPLKTLRVQWKESSRFLFAKTKVMRKALGSSEAEEAQKNVHKLAGQLHGSCGLLFTNKPKEDVIKWFQEYSELEYARAGFRPTETVTLPEGPLDGFTTSAIEPYLRGRGLPTKLDKGVIVLRKAYTVCTADEPLDPKQASILKLLGKQMAEFKIVLTCVWSKDGSFEKFKVPEEVRRTFNPKKSNKNIVNKKTPDRTPNQGKQTPKSTPKQGNQTPKSTQKQGNQTPQSILSQSSHTPKSNPNQDGQTPRLTPKQDKTTPKSMPKQNKTTPKLTPKSTPSNGQKAESDTTVVLERTPNGFIVESKIPTEMPVQEEEMEVDSPKPAKRNLRRSMRTPKPIRRTPEQARQSVKKLTESAKHLKKTPAKQTPAKQTPARQTPAKQTPAKAKTPMTPGPNRTKRSLAKGLDVKMAE